MQVPIKAIVKRKAQQQCSPAKVAFGANTQRV